MSVAQDALDALVEAAAQRMFQVCAAYHDGGPGNTILLALCRGGAEILRKPIEALRHDDIGSGWRRMRDPYRCPVWALPWLAQHVGLAHLDPGLTEDQVRTLIATVPNWDAGSNDQIINATKLTLTGTQYVALFERDSSPYHLTVLTRTSETPDSAKTLTAILGQKPVGIVLDYETVDGETWEEVPDDVTWASVDGTLTWANALNWNPS